MVDDTRICVADDCERSFVCRMGSPRRYCSETCSLRMKTRRRTARRLSQPCSVKGCGRPGTRTRGHCETHYARRQKGIPEDAPDHRKINAGNCRNAGCAKRAYCQGLCKRHYLKMKASEGVDWAILAYDAGGETGVRNKTDVYGGSFEVVNRFAVYERDGWVCQLCGEPVDPDLKGPDPMCASIDHVVPLSHGGDHSMGNVQLTHLGCNSAKGNRV